MANFAQSLAELAEYVAKKAKQNDTIFAETLDAFGKLTTYYGVISKRSTSAVESSTEPTIANFAERLRNVEKPDGAGECAGVPTRTRRAS